MSRKRKHIVVFNDGILKADLVPEGYVCIQWLTNTKGFLQKTCVKDFFKVERLIRSNRWKGWAMASEVENEAMHKILVKVGGVPVNRDDKYIYFAKEFPCAVPLKQSVAV